MIEIFDCTHAALQPTFPSDPDSAIWTHERYTGTERRLGAGRRRSDLTASQQIDLTRAMIAFGELSASQEEPKWIFLRLLECAASFANGCEFSISLKHDDGALRVIASSSDVVRLLTEHQIEDEGPAASVTRTGSVAYDLKLDERPEQHPQISALANAVGFRVMHVIPFVADGNVLGSLCIYDTKVRNFSEIRMDLLLALAAASARSLANQTSHRKIAALADQLQTALNSRVVIEQAKGVVAARLGLDPESAFALLHRYARNNGKKIHDVCRDAIDGKLTGLQLREVGGKGQLSA